MSSLNEEMGDVDFFDISLIVDDNGNQISSPQIPPEKVEEPPLIGLKSTKTLVEKLDHVYRNYHVPPQDREMIAKMVHEYEKLVNHLSIAMRRWEKDSNGHKPNRVEPELDLERGELMDIYVTIEEILAVSKKLEQKIASYPTTGMGSVPNWYSREAAASTNGVQTRLNEP